MTGPSLAQASSLAAFRAQRAQVPSVQDTMAAINEACRRRGGPFAEYSCKTVSWDDVDRGTAGGGLSCWGANITDTRLWARDGRLLFTVRPDNWDEKLGRVSSSDLAVVVGNHLPGSAARHPVTLRALLDRFGEFGSYAGLRPDLCLAAGMDARVSVRYQVTFLPVGDGARAALEFATEAYNYNTRSDADPRNLVVLCTSQGLAVQADGAGAKKLFHHGVDAAGRVHRHWLEAERSDHKVGGAQQETAAEKADALQRGKATSTVIGPRALGTRFNVLMTLQVPLKQQPPRTKKRTSASLGAGFFPSMNFSLFGAGGSIACGAAAPMLKCAALDDAAPVEPPGMPAMPEMMDEMMDDVPYGPPESDDERASACSCEEECEDVDAADFMDCLPPSAPSAPNCARRPPRGAVPRTRGPPRGTANAARVSVGSEVDVWPGMKLAPERHPSEHVTATVVLYYTVAGGVPTEADVAAAVQDLEELYAASHCGRLADAEFDFMKSPLDAQVLGGIHAKVTEQPYTPAPSGVTGHDVFPSD